MDTTETKPILLPELLEQALTLEEKQVIVHCCFPASPDFGSLIRIWRSTFLLDEHTGHRSTLVHAENITFYPWWTEVPPMRDFWFTLIFSGLPADCKSFHLKEIIPQEGGFFISNIRRNSSDVYRVMIS